MASSLTGLAFVVLFAVQLGWYAVPAQAMEATEVDDMYWAHVKGSGSDFVHSGVVRTHFIQAEEVVWDYAPNGINSVKGVAFSDEAKVFVQNGPGRIGSRYLKCLYRGYTDNTFSTPIVRSPHEAHLGLQGPVIRAEVGDTVEVHFRNQCRFPASVHVHGLQYTKSNEGAPYNDGSSNGDKGDDSIAPGDSYTYTWQVPDQAGPGPEGSGDGSSIMWLYHGGVNEILNTYAGLIGSIVVTRRGHAQPNGAPQDVQKEVFLLWTIMDENKSPYIHYNFNKFALNPAPTNWQDDPDVHESNLMHSINGYVYGNQPIVSLCNGERVRWYNLGMGNEVDLHTPHWHGNVVTVNGQRADVISLLPASMVVADMVPYNIGLWMNHCHVNDHIDAGMIAMYSVSQCAPLTARRMLPK